MRAEPVGIALAIGAGRGRLPAARPRHGGYGRPLRRARPPARSPLAEALALLRRCSRTRRPQDRPQRQGRGRSSSPATASRSAPIDDTMLISYALHAGQHGHGTRLPRRDLPRPRARIGEGADRQRQGRAAASPSSPSRRPAACARRAGRGHPAACGWRLKPRLPFARVTRVYETMERPLVPVLAEMEAPRRPRRPRSALSRLSGDFAQRMAGARGRDPRPRRRPLQRRLARSSSARCSSTRWASAAARRARPAPRRTGADVLEELAAQGHDLPARVLDWRHALQAEVDLHRHAAGRDQPRDRPRAHLLP